MTGTCETRNEGQTVPPGTMRDDHPERTSWGDAGPLAVIQWSPPFWSEPSQSRFECEVIIAREDDGFVSYAALLPGVVSQGDTFEKALEGVREALVGAITSYLTHNEPIPWTEGEVEVHGSDPVSKWIDVDV